MFTIIRTKKLNELNQQLDGLRSVNAEKDQRIATIEGYVKQLEQDRDNLRELDNSRREEVSLLRTQNDEHKANIAAQDFIIDELKAQAKITNGKLLKANDEAFQLRGKIEQLEAEVNRYKNAAQEQKELREAVVKSEKQTEEIPNTTKSVELPEVAMEADVVPTPAPSVDATIGSEVRFRVGMYVRVPSDLDDEYLSDLTSGKMYRIFDTASYRCGKILDDVGVEITVCPGIKSNHLRGAFWEMVPESEWPKEDEVVPTPAPSNNPNVKRRYTKRKRK